MCLKGFTMDQDADHGFPAASLCDGSSYPIEMSDQQVADYLERNPDFFVSRPPSWTCSGTGSMC